MKTWMILTCGQIFCLGIFAGSAIATKQYHNPLLYIALAWAIFETWRVYRIIK